VLAIVMKVTKQYGQTKSRIFFFFVITLLNSSIDENCAGNSEDVSDEREENESGNKRNF